MEIFHILSKTLPYTWLPWRKQKTAPVKKQEMNQKLRRGRLLSLNSELTTRAPINPDTENIPLVIAHRTSLFRVKSPEFLNSLSIFWSFFFLAKYLLMFPCRTWTLTIEWLSDCTGDFPGNMKDISYIFQYFPLLSPGEDRNNKTVLWLQ